MTKIGTGDPFLDRLVVIAAILLFSATASVMSYHAPDMLNQIIGADVSYVFGIVSALCVEAGALRLHFNKRAQKVPAAHWVKWILLAVSGLCQVYNGEIETGNISNMSETLKLMFTWLVPNIPLLFIVLQFWVGHLPDEDEEVAEARQPQVGLKKRLSRLWNGDKENTVLPPIVQTNIDPEERANGEVKESFTSRQR